MIKQGLKNDSLMEKKSIKSTFFRQPLTWTYDNHVNVWLGQTSFVVNIHPPFHQDHWTYKGLQIKVQYKSIQKKNWII